MKAKRINRTYIIIAFIIGLAILGYGFLNYQAKLLDYQVKQETLKKETNREDLFYKCVKGIGESYEENWTAQCKDFGIDVKTKHCHLPLDIADGLTDRMIELRENCAKLYKE